MPRSALARATAPPRGDVSVVMLEGDHIGPVEVHAGQRLMLLGSVAGDVHVHDGAYASVRGRIDGDLLLDGGSALVRGVVGGCVRGGTAMIAPGARVLRQARPVPAKRAAGSALTPTEYRVAMTIALALASAAGMLLVRPL